MEKYVELKEHLKNVLKTAKKLGLNVQTGGGYAMGYDINNLPPYPVGLIGALSIVEGQGARCKLGLTFDQTQSLEAGFDGRYPDTKSKKKKKRKNFQIDTELMRVGVELTAFAQKPKPLKYNSNNDFQFDNYPAQPAQDNWPAAPVGYVQFANAAAAIPQAPPQVVVIGEAHAPKPNVWVNYGEAAAEAKLEVEAYNKNKKEVLDKILDNFEAKIAQVAPEEGEAKKVVNAAEELLKQIELGGEIPQGVQMNDNPAQWLAAEIVEAAKKLKAQNDAELDILNGPAKAVLPDLHADFVVGGHAKQPWQWDEDPIEEDLAAFGLAVKFND